MLYDVTILTEPSYLNPEITSDYLANVMREDALLKEALENTPLKKAAEPTDVANTVLYLASDLSYHVSGETIYITGGM